MVEDRVSTDDRAVEIKKTTHLGLRNNWVSEDFEINCFLPNFITTHATWLAGTISM